METIKKLANRALRVFHVTGFWSANYFYQLYLPAITKGWEVSNEYIEDSNQSRAHEIAEKMKRNDVVTFQRPNSSHQVELMKIAKQMGKIVVFADDDTFKLGEGIVPKNEEETAFGEKVNMYRTEALKVAHGAIATTEFLATELREFNNRVCVIPNCIDPDDAGECAPNTTGRPRILILGSVISNDDWHIARKAIEKVADRVTFVLMGVPKEGQYGTYDEDMKFWDSLPHVEKHGFTVFGDYYNTIQMLACDLAIAPRADNYFNRCKSNLKFLESSLFAIPFIGQTFSDGLSPYQVNPEDAKYMILAQTEDDWVDKLEHTIDQVVNNPQRVKEFGQEAQKYVIETYDINKHADKWEKFYLSLM